MKKIIIILSALCIVSFFPEYLANTKASEKTQQELPNFTTSSKGKNQLYGYFMLELYHNEIMSAIQEYYNDNKIEGYGTPSKKHYDMVSISFKGNKDYKGLEKFSYVLKITLIPSYSNGKTVGTDTLYFAVEPTRQTMENLPKEYPPIELIKYEHSKPPKIQNE
ncbi:MULTISPECIES: hypothetical protein [Peribacillus]|uniref:DUF3888 domain-containing protein n=1 Tax=Peribacillus simplex TaxID=1478 RepID=A0A9W4L6T9_9BACI|nr:MULTISPECIES: hypothetical protein [Peribacillus]MED3790800.1 hypothetical protein [Peribacillus frigoritolerans]CAH0276504.1 hypothetical protein SRABI133_03816 [Peribacillus simplex]